MKNVLTPLLPVSLVSLIAVGVSVAVGVSAATLQTHALVEFVKPMTAEIADMDGTAWTVTGDVDGQVQVTVEWRDADGNVVVTQGGALSEVSTMAGLVEVSSPHQALPVVTLVLCRE